jgi:hypothetical protein
VSGISRRSALVAACGSLASAASVGAWMLSGWVQDTVPTHARRIRTSFGSVRVVASRWEAGARPVAGEAADRSPVDPASWSDRVVVLVEVQNETRQPVRVAPGQFRLRVGSRGPTVDFLRAEPHGGTVAPGRVLHLLLTFAVSQQGTTFGLEYWDPAAGASLGTAAARIAPQPAT